MQLAHSLAEATAADLTMKGVGIKPKPSDNANVIGAAGCNLSLTP
jgi:hypothetical protein